jgi:very-short-patch-repair endonuclease
VDDTTLITLASTQHGVFSRAQARTLRIGRSALEHRVRKGRFERLSDQIFRVSGTPDSERSAVMATTLSGGPDAVASGPTSLALHRVRDHRLLPALVVVGRRPPRGALPGVRESFRLLGHHRTVVDGIPTATVARALFDLAGVSSPRQTARSVDAALSARATSYTELSELLDELATSGRTGIVVMRQLLIERAGSYVPTRSTLESAFSELLTERGVESPQRQFSISGIRGWIGTVDFAWPDARVVVETDGGEFHDSLIDRENDERRDRELEAEGWVVLRFGRRDVVHRPTSVVRTLRAALRRAA